MYIYFYETDEFFRAAPDASGHNSTLLGKKALTSGMKISQQRYLRCFVFSFELSLTLKVYFISDLKSIRSKDFLKILENDFENRRIDIIFNFFKGFFPLRGQSSLYRGETSRVPDKFSAR